MCHVTYQIKPLKLFLTFFSLKYMSWAQINSIVRLISYCRGRYYDLYNKTLRKGYAKIFGHTNGLFFLILYHYPVT